MANANITICGQRVALGERRDIQATVSELYTGRSLNMPITVLRSSAPGPIVFIMAALHGDELNGVEIVRRLIHEESYDGLRGTLLLVPVANPFGFLHHSRYLPDRRDPNRSFPGNPTGSPTARLTSFLMREIVQHSDYGVELHTATTGRRNLPHVRADASHGKLMELARAFAARAILCSTPPRGSLREAAWASGVPVILYEGGEGLKLEEDAVGYGVAGCQGLLRHLDMLPPEKAPPRTEVPELKQTRWQRVNRGGLLTLRVGLGDRLRKGDVLGVVHNPLGKEREEIRAGRGGTVLGFNTQPLVNPGDAVCHLGW